MQRLLIGLGALIILAGILWPWPARLPLGQEPLRRRPKKESPAIAGLSMVVLKDRSRG